MLTHFLLRRRNMKFTTRRRSCSLVSSTQMDTSSTRTSSRSVSSSRVEKYVRKMGGVLDLQLQFVRSSDLLYCIGCFVFAIGYTIHSQSAMCFFFFVPIRPCACERRKRRQWPTNRNVQNDIMQSRTIRAVRMCCCGAISGQLRISTDK